jgi:hypothetical protein
MTQEDQNAAEVRRIRRLLRQIARLAKEASLTGGLEKGARTSVQQYNRAVHVLEQHLEAIPDGFFPPLAEDASMEEVGVAAFQLAGYLEEDGEDSRSEERHRGSHGHHGSHNSVNIKIGELKDLADLKNLGQLVRDHLPEWLGEKVVNQVETVVAGSEKDAATLSDVESRLAEVGARLQAVAEQLRRGDLTDDQRADLAEQLSRLGQEQARLARRHAALRAEAGAE